MTDTPNLCHEPGCGLPLKWFNRREREDWGYRCPRNADAHALCAKLAESEAQLNALEEQLLSVLPEDFGAVEYIKHLTAANAALEEKLREAAKPCEWAEDQDEGLWTATCGLVDWCFNEGGPIENKVHHCVGCGHPVVVKDSRDAAKEE